MTRYEERFYQDIHTISETLKQLIKILEEKKIINKCKYCGSITNSTDEDVLCSDCQSTFGHIFYSEL